MAEPVSPLLEKDEVTVPKPKYSPEEEEYLGNLKKSMIQARDMRDQEHEEFDGMDYVTYYQSNERLANTFITPKRNKEDTNFQSGIVRQKLFALLASLVNLNLAGDISAFDSQEVKISALGNAMEDIILKTKELDNDDEKKFLRQYELLKHGTVFVEEIWDDRQKKEKKLTKKFNGKIKGTEWSTRIKKAFAKPTRNILPGLNVYMGDITKYDISEQPRVFTVDTVPYEEAKSMFQSWERWVNVPKKLTKVDSSQANAVSTDWTLLETQENYVEILRYQDKWNNEFAVLLNGVLMTPVGLPLPWGYEDYNIAQQNLEPIHHKFAYGKSLVARLRNKSALLDETLRIAVLKNQKSFAPPRYNISGKVVSNRIFMPGKINYGIQPGTLPPIEGENTGVTQAEFNMIKEIQESINNETVSPTFQGQQSGPGTTATEIVELQRQAKMVLGLTIFSVSMLEWKLEWLRLKNLLANWFDPSDQVLDEVKGLLKDKYRSAGVDRPIEGEGMGRRIVIPTKQIPSGPAIMKAEQSLTEEQGMPVRLIFLNPDEVCAASIIWQIVIRPSEKPTSEIQKLMFRAFIQDAMVFGPMLNMPGMAEEFASVWQKDPKKIFKSPDQMQIDQMQQAQAAQQTKTGDTPGANPPPPPANPALSSRVALPNANPGKQLQVTQ